MNKIREEFQNFESLLIGVTNIFKELDPNDQRDIIFFLQNFKNNYLLPDSAKIYIEEIPVESLEITSEDKFSDVLISGMEKYKKLNYSQKAIPPIIAIRGGLRQILIYGEMNAIESFMNNKLVKAIIIEVGEEEMFDLFDIDEDETIYLIALLERNPIL